MPLVLRCAFPTTGDQLHTKVLNWKASSSVVFFRRPSFSQRPSRASSMSSGGTLSPRQQEGSYSERWALCHSSGLMVALRTAWKRQNLAWSCKDAYPAATNTLLSRPPVALNGHYFVIYSQACRRENKHRHNKVAMNANSVDGKD